MITWDSPIKWQKLGTYSRCSDAVPDLGDTVIIIQTMITSTLIAFKG